MAARKPVSTPSAAELSAVRIERVGAEGDGVATLADGSRLYIPLTLTGEVVQAHVVGRRGEGWAAMADAIAEASPARVAPPCAHFGTCGGCTLQHWEDGAYITWKRELLCDALRRAGYATVDVAPLLRTAPARRRRMDLAVRRTRAGVIAGLHPREASADSICNMTECPILHPALFALISPLRAVLARLPAVRRDGSIVANMLDSGPDLLLRTDAALSPSDRASLTAFMRAHNLPRVSWGRDRGEPEPVAIQRPAVVTFSGVAVSPPPGAFLQATIEGEASIVAAVLSALPDRLPARAQVAELYAGVGTLTFALAPRARVAAFEGNAAMVSALRAAANKAGLGGKIGAAQRDLARQPLGAKELASYAAVVLDPPFAGAPAQVNEIAAAKVPSVIYVSCSPAALARDARVLHSAGYTLRTATPVDQFLWSARLESVVAFELGRDKKQRRAP